MKEIRSKFRENVRGKKVVRRTMRKRNVIEAMELMIDSEKSETCTSRIKDRHTQRQRD